MDYLRFFGGKFFFEDTFDTLTDRRLVSVLVSSMESLVQQGGLTLLLRQKRADGDGKDGRLGDSGMRAAIVALSHLPVEPESDYFRTNAGRNAAYLTNLSQ